MRLRINGEITADRLAEALEIASKKYEAVRPGFKLYGANLYIQAFDSNGLRFDLGNSRGKELVITLPTKSGELAKPALTSEGERSRQQAIDEVNQWNEEAERKNAEAVRRNAEAHAKAIRDQREYNETLEKNRIYFKKVNEVTAEILKSTPDLFLSELNETIQGVWNDLNPIYEKGKKKGQPVSLPVFSFHAGELLLSTATLKHPMRVQNPIYRNGNLQPFWMYDAWTEATRRMLAKLGASVDGSTVPLF